MLHSHDRSRHNKTIPLVSTLNAAVKGRGRYKVAGLRGSSSLAQFIEAKLAKKPFIEKVSVNVASGNVLVLFAKTVNHSEILHLLKAVALDYRSQKRQTKQFSHSALPLSTTLPTRQSTAHDSWEKPLSWAHPEDGGCRKRDKKRRN
jgi:Heavy metal associated domain 2